MKAFVTGMVEHFGAGYAFFLSTIIENTNIQN